MANRYVVTDEDRRAQALAVPATAPIDRHEPSAFVRGTVHSVSFRDGRMESSAHPVMRAATVSRVPEGYVRLASGDVTPLASVKAAGLESLIVEHGESLDGVGQRSIETAKAPQTVRADEHAQDSEGSAETNAAPETGAGQLDVSESEKATMEAATAALETINGVVGAEATNAAIDDTIVSGEVPTELPPGVSHTEVNAVIAGFEAQANAVLKETGASVDLLNEMLSDGELREARRAVFMNDDSALRNLGAQAVRRLERLPEKPDKLRALTAGFGPKVRVHQKNGETWVTTPNWDMSWSRAVRTGKVSF